MIIANVEKGYDFYLSIYLFIFCSVFVFVCILDCYCYLSINYMEQ